MSLLSVSDLRVTFAGQQDLVEAVSGVSFEVNKSTRMVQRIGLKRLEVFQQGVHPFLILLQHFIAVDRAVMAGV